jgi:hypothetical protein
MAPTRRIQIVLDAAQWTALRHNQKEAGITMRAQIKQAIDEWLHEKSPRAKPTRSKARR